MSADPGPPVDEPPRSASTSPEDSATSSDDSATGSDGDQRPAEQEAVRGSDAGSASFGYGSPAAGSDRDARGRPPTSASAVARGEDPEYDAVAPGRGEVQSRADRIAVEAAPATGDDANPDVETDPEADPAAEPAAEPGG